jgi:xylulokinase
MKQYVIGIDHGSGGCKVTIIDSDGQFVSEAYESYPSYYPHPRWVEQKPEEWIDAAVRGVRRAVALLSEADRHAIRAISFTAPHHVAVLMDENFRVLRDVIMWNDQRSGEEAQELGRAYGDEIVRITGNYPTPTWTLCQLAWLRKYEPEVLERTKKIAFMKDYVRFRFSGEWVTDYIEGEGTLFFDIHKRQWSDKLCKLIGLDTATLPEIRSPMDQSGTLQPEMAERLGLPAGIPIIIGTADSTSEVYGCGTVEAGDGVVKLATAGNFSLVTEDLPVNNIVISYEHVINGLYYHNSATNFAAASFRWFRETFLPEWEETMSSAALYEKINAQMAKVPPGSEGLIFQPYLNGERCPHWDPYLRGNFFGITTRHDRAYFARSVMEGVAYSIRDAALVFEQRPSKPLKMIGGGSKSAVWVQIMADVLQAELEVPQVSDASFGACLIAATAAGWYRDLKEAVRHAQKIVSRVSPIERNTRIYDEMFAIYQDLHRHTKALSHRIGQVVQQNQY